MKNVSCLLLATLLLAACTKENETSGAPGTASSGQAAGAASGTVDVGSQMPPYKGKKLDGSEFDLAREKGNVILLNVWATWCPPCRYEIPELQRIHDSYAGRQFKVIGVSVDEGSADEVKQFVTDQKMSYPIVLDPKGTMAELLQTSVLPTSVLLDRKGKVVWKHFGPVDMNDGEMRRALDTALNG